MFQIKRSLNFPGLPSIECFLENLNSLFNIHGIDYLLHYALEWFYPYYNISSIVSMVNLFEYVKVIFIINLSGIIFSV